MRPRLPHSVGMEAGKRRPPRWDQHVRLEWPQPTLSEEDDDDGHRRPPSVVSLVRDARGRRFDRLVLAADGEDRGERQIRREEREEALHLRTRSYPPFLPLASHEERAREMPRACGLLVPRGVASS